MAGHENVDKMAGPRLRKVTERDSRLLWQWRNDSDTRREFFDQNEVIWDHHQGWFRGKLKDKNCFWNILEDEDGKPVAQVRFDIDNRGDAVVSVSVVPSERGKGHGTRALQLATRSMMESIPDAKRAVANIRRENVASIQTFAGAGYTSSGETSVAGVRTATMIMSRWCDAT